MTRSVLLQQARRIVIKLGTGILTNEANLPDVQQLNRLVEQVAQLRAQSREVILVTSGAVGAGMGTMGLIKRPR